MLLKELHDVIAPVLTQIFQISLTSGIVPNDWKHAIVAPVYKKGPKSKPNNYRPISLTCIASKLMEHILVSNIMSHYDEHGILSPYQHGFRSQHSCETQLIGFSQEVHDNLQQGQQTDIIVMDYSKAFDKVDHHKLLLKLQRL
jgi:retron-type reverse transcriptase